MTETNKLQNEELQPEPAAVTLKKRKRRRLRVSCINTSNCRYDLVRFTSHKFAMKESLENWNIYWTDLSTSVQRCKDMKRYQRINHFPGMLEICRKDLLARNLNRMLKTFSAEYSIFPKTWCLPADIAEIVEYIKTHKGKCFIVKPDLGCQGRGIAITKNINQLKTYDKMICQVYIQRPFLIDGFKFDLRIYTLITSCNPLRIFVYNEGLARFATAKYKEPNSDNAKNLYMHLTNYSVNKHSRAYIVDDVDGSKRRLSTINQWFVRNNYDVKKIWNAIDDVIVKTIIVSLPTLQHYYRTCFPDHTSSHACFEILGFDFMFDSHLKPYILEVNHSPSFHTDTTIDHEVKESLLYDTFRILNLAHNNKSKFISEDKKKTRDRLLCTQTGDNNIGDKIETDQITKDRIKWENNHMGNYRKIYPNEKTEYYDKFISARQKNISAETIASKARGAAQKLQGEHVNAPIKRKPVKPETNKNHNSMPIPVENKIKPVAAFEPAVIDASDEKERMCAMAKREFLIKSHGILEKVYENLKNAGLLRLEDDVKFGRSNEWTHDNKTDQSYRHRYQRFNASMVKVLDCISRKPQIEILKQTCALSTDHNAGDSVDVPGCHETLRTDTESAHFKEDNRENGQRRGLNSGLDTTEDGICLNENVIVQNM